MDRWRRLDSSRLQDCRIFDLDRVRLAPPDGGPAGEFFVLRAPEWVNVIPLTARREVVLVRQFRFGIEEATLEIPGGMCDAGESPGDAAAREMLEETGYASPSIVPLGWVHPNPAIQTNRCHSFLAPGARAVAEASPDPHERIEVVTVPLDRIPALVREGAIRHALVVSAFHLLSLRSEGGGSEAGAISGA